MDDRNLERSNGLGDILARTAARDPNRLAIVWRGRRDPYGEYNAAVNRAAHSLTKFGSCGRAVPNVETRVDDDDEEVPGGEIGEIVHRSPHALLSYWSDEEKTGRPGRLIVSDGHRGLAKAIEAWPQVQVQRCCLHKWQNLVKHCPAHAHHEPKREYDRIVYAKSGLAAREAYVPDLRGEVAEAVRFYFTTSAIRAGK